MHILKFHAVSRTHQGRQRESSIKTLRSTLTVEFLSVGTQYRVLRRHQSEDMNDLIFFYLKEILAFCTPLYKL